MRAFHNSYCRCTAGISFSTPLPVCADSIITGTPRRRGSARNSASFTVWRTSLRSSFKSHLLMAMTRARPSRSTKSASWISCLSNGLVASMSSTTTSANFTARKPSATDSFSSFSVTRALRRTPAVSHSVIGRAPLGAASSAHVQLTEILSRVIPASGPVNSRSSLSR